MEKKTNNLQKVAMATLAIIVVGMGITIITFLFFCQNNPEGPENVAPAPVPEIEEPKEGNESNESEEIFCTMDAKECPDGSFVGRDPENNCEFNPCPGEEGGENQIDTSGWQTYRNEEYGFEFQYPSSLAPIEFVQTQGCSLSLVFYEREIVERALSENPPNKKPDATLEASFCLRDGGNSNQSIQEFIESRSYGEMAQFFREIKGGEFQAMEFADQPERRGYIIVIKLSPGVFAELGSRIDLNSLRDIQSTLQALSPNERL